MSEPQHPQGFAMPMIKDFVPNKLKPWLYVWLAFTFQLAGGAYLGGMEHIRGSMAVLREDLMMCMYATLAGLAVTFPLLFRTKFRFTNRTLLLTSAGAIALFNFLAFYIDNVYLLWVLCFFVGVFKLQGTFECMSNIQLWMTPTRDFAVFFPILHIFIMVAVTLSEVLSLIICYYMTWKYMNFLVCGIMLFNMIWLFICTRHFRFMKKMPFVGIDWLGAVLWSLLILQIAFIFCFGEYYDWLASETIRVAIFTSLVTLTLAVVRMVMIRHPYITPGIFRVKQLPRFLIFALVVEIILATYHVCEEIFFEAGPGWDAHQRLPLNISVIAGILVAVGFALIWLFKLKLGNVRLIAIAMGAYGGYALWFYFMMHPGIPLESYHLPMFLRGFASTLIGITLLYQLKSFMHFMVFFQSVTMLQAIHLVIGGVVGAAVYAFAMRWGIADSLAHAASHWEGAAVGPLGAEETRQIVHGAQLVAIKRVYGLVAYASLGAFIFILMWDIPFSRNVRQRIPAPRVIGSALAKRLTRHHSDVE